MTISEVLHNELNTLRAENASLKGQVAQLELIKDEHDERGIDIAILVQNLNSAEAKLTTLQSKSAALVDTLTQVREQCLFADDDGQIGVSSEAQIDSRLFDEICAALAAFKGEK